MASPKAEYSLDNARKFGWSSVTGELVPERLAALVVLVLGPRVLDAGCGGGAYVQYLLGRGFDARGVDLLEMFVEVAGARLPVGRVVQGDLQALPFADHSFDTSICLDVLEHIDDRAALAELARVTRRRLIVAVPRANDELARFGLAFGTYSDLTHLRYYTNDSLHALLSSVPHRRIEVRADIVLDFKQLALNMLSVRQTVPLVSWVQLKLMRLLLRRAQQRSLYAGVVGVVDLA